MRHIKTKICGLKREIDIQLCMQLGVDVLGFVVEYPIEVPWNLNCSEVLPLLSMVHPPHQSCIVTGGTPEKVIRLARILCPSMVQLHYKETLEDTIIISDALRKLNIDVIKAVPPTMEDRISQFKTTDIEIIVRKLCETSVYALLADSRVPSNATQKGTKLDPKFCAQIVNISSKPVIIAGGINANNISGLLVQTGAEFIDVMTGVETLPGEKDAKLLSLLLSTL